LWLLGSAALGVDRSFSWHAAPMIQAVPTWTAMTFRVFTDFSTRPPLPRFIGLFLGFLPLAAAARGAFRGGLRARFWLIWLAGYAALFLNWEPFTMVYRISDLLALWALALIGLEALPSRARAAALAAWTAAALAFNFAITVHPATDPAANRDLAEARWSEQRVPEDGWVLSYGNGAVYLPYFAHRKVVNLRYLEAPGALEERLDRLNARGETVFVSDRTLDLTGSLAPLAAYGLQPAGASDGLTLFRVRRAVTARRR
jgi:hypothetical protein